MVRSGLQEPLTTHSDHYNTNNTYSTNAYSKGEMFLEQLGYIVGDDVRNNILLECYRLWRFKHPNADDFMKVAEDVSGLKLDWYKEYWVQTTKTIDYGIDSLWEENGVSKIRLKRVGQMPMPIDLELTFKVAKRCITFLWMRCLAKSLLRIVRQELYMKNGGGHTHTILLSLSTALPTLKLRR